VSAPFSKLMRGGTAGIWDGRKGTAGRGGTGSAVGSGLSEAGVLAEGFFVRLAAFPPAPVCLMELAVAEACDGAAATDGGANPASSQVPAKMTPKVRLPTAIIGPNSLILHPGNPASFSHSALNRRQIAAVWLFTSFDASARILNSAARDNCCPII
jgi:hypothetical protein